MEIEAISEIEYLFHEFIENINLTIIYNQEMINLTIFKHTIYIF